MLSKITYFFNIYFFFKSVYKYNDGKINNDNEIIIPGAELQRCAFHFLYFLDIDECAMKTDNCSLNATCNNTEGSFNCTCKPGFTGNGFSCTGN